MQRDRAIKKKMFASSPMSRTRSLEKAIDISRHPSRDTGNEVFGRKPGQSIPFTNDAR